VNSKLGTPFINLHDIYGLTNSTSIQLEKFLRIAKLVGPLNGTVRLQKGCFCYYQPEMATLLSPLLVIEVSKFTPDLKAGRYLSKKRALE